MNRVQQYFHPWQSFKKFPKPPGRIQRQPGVKINDLPQQSTINGIAQGQHHRRKPKLKVHCRPKRPLATDFQNVRRGGQITAHRFLDQHPGPLGQDCQYFGMSIGRRGQIKDDVTLRSGFLRCGIGNEPVFFGQGLRLFQIRVIDTLDNKTRGGIGRDMGIGHD